MVTKAAVAKEIKKNSGATYATASLCIDVLVESIYEGLVRGERIELRGFGTFYISRQAARKTNINGQAVVPEHGKIVFRPCEKLRRAVWECKK